MPELQWEYRKEIKYTPPSTQELAEYRRKGWEVVAVKRDSLVDDPRYSSKHITYQVSFRRRVPSEPLEPAAG